MFAEAIDVRAITLKNLDHDLLLKDGPKDKCVNESVRYLASKNILLFDGNQSFTLENSNSIEKELGQCQYVEEVKVSEREVRVKTDRKNCPKASENGTVLESINLIITKPEEIHYLNSFNNKSFKCIYSLQMKKSVEKK